MSPWVRDLVSESAQAHGIEPHILLGLVQQESGGSPDAIRYEPQFSNLERPGDFARGVQSLATETVQQKMSWGLCQIMGATARRFGFDHPYLTELCRLPRLSVDYGCLHLLRDLDTGVTIHVALARYNGGKSGNPRPDGSLRNQTYVDSVLTNSRKFT